MDRKMRQVQNLLLLMVFVACEFFASGQTLQTLYSFSGTDGANPYAALTVGPDGNLYGTTSKGGTNNYGTIFQFTTNGTLNTLFSFSGTNGANPEAQLTLGNDGNLYGTAYAGGITNSSFTNGSGTVFQITTNAVFTTLVFLDGVNNAYPNGLTLGTDGNFYGTTAAGTSFWGSSGYAFRVSTNGLFSNLVYFGTGEYGLSSLYYPSTLTLGSNGNFYGTANGPNVLGISYGWAFMMTTNGTVTKLAPFISPNDNNGTLDGLSPSAALTKGNDGNFYGTTEESGSSGSVFQLTTNGVLTQLLYFNGTNGSNPMGTLTQGNDGNFYGTTFAGGNINLGTVFMTTTNGMLTTLLSFNFTNGANPLAGLTMGTDGYFYGTTSLGGNSNSGTVFRLLLPPFITVQPQNTTNIAGGSVTYFVNVTSLQPVLGYIWQKNGTNLNDGANISGTTTNRLNITGISDNDMASYSVVVSNISGSVTSSDVTSLFQAS